jgi:hypothetical protein
MLRGTRRGGNRKSSDEREGTGLIVGQSTAQDSEMPPISRRTALKLLSAATLPVFARRAEAAPSAFGIGSFKLGLVTYNLAKD